jgi:hypothetical protein
LLPIDALWLLPEKDKAFIDTIHLKCAKEDCELGRTSSFLVLSASIWRVLVKYFLTSSSLRGGGGGGGGGDGGGGNDDEEGEEGEEVSLSCLGSTV